MTAKKTPAWAFARSRWTRFYDMHSGGSSKLAWDIIWIEAPEAEARKYFQRRFHRDPDHVTCPCCGADYSLDEETSFAKSTSFERGAAWGSALRVRDGERPSPTFFSSRPYIAVPKFLAKAAEKKSGLLVIRKREMARLP